MRKNTDFEKFNYTDTIIDKTFVDRRIMLTFSSCWWHYCIANLKSKKLTFKGLKVVEVGCGSATKSLVLALLGAEVTLIDIDEEALEVARKCFDLYECKAVYLKANVLDKPPEDLSGMFDHVTSGGLIEHFIGAERTKVLEFHRKLLSNNGFAIISSPNRLSPLYWVARLAGMIAGSWQIEIELPFDNIEFKNRAKIAGFKNINVKKIMSIKQDFILHVMAIFSYLAKLLPGNFREKLKKMPFYRKAKDMEIPQKANNLDDIRIFIEEEMQKITAGKSNSISKHSLYDYFCTGIVLIGEQNYKS